MDSFLTAALLGLVLPVLVCGIVLAIGLAVGRRAGLSSDARWCVALAIGAGYLVGHVVSHRPAWPPIDVEHRVPFLALAALVVGLLDAIWPGPAWTRWENRLILSAVVVIVTLGPAVQETWDARPTVLWLAGLGLGIVISWAHLDALAERNRGGAILMPLLVVVGGTSAVLALSGSVTLGQFGGVLTAAVGAAWVVSWWARSLSLARGGVPIVVVVLSALLLEGHVYAGLQASSMAALALSPLAIWVERIGVVRRMSPWKGTIIAAAAAAVPVGVAVALALASAPPSSLPSEY